MLHPTQGKRVNFKLTHYPIAQYAERRVSSAIGEEDVAVRVNWLAILLAGIADWLLGAVWFTAFANQWRSGTRMPAEELQTHMSHPNFWPFLVAFLCSFLMAYVIARLVRQFRNA